MKKIAVVGSINMDLVVESSVIPKMGETIIGDNFFSGPGGKGANQAVAIARLGGDVTFFGSVGNDYFGKELEQYLAAENVKNVIRTDDNLSTGVALINLFENDNNIIVIPGSNGYYSLSYKDELLNKLREFDIVLFQLEISENLVFELIEELSKEEITIILNPAPAIKIPTEIIDKIDYLTPNEHECQIVFDSKENIEAIVSKYPEKLIVTYGEKGAFYSVDEKLLNIKSMKIDNVVDTTGAGDTFSGAFSFSLSVDMNLEKAIEFSNVAAGLSITKKGAQSGMPSYEEVIKGIQDYKQQGDHL